MNRTKVVVVTGATGGIGSAICATLSREKYTIVAHYNRNRSKAEELAKTLQRHGLQCHLVAADLSTDDGIDLIVAAVENVLDRNPGHQLWALVNNAAKLLGPSFSEASPKEFDEYFTINTKAAFFLTQRLVCRMPSGGSIVNVSSASAHFSSPGDIIYAMSKASLESMTRNAAEAIAPHGVRINSIVPGFTNNGHPAFNNPEIRRYMSSFSAMGDVSAPETVADGVKFLISENAARTTGAILDVSGGSLLGARGNRASTVGALLDEATPQLDEAPPD